MAASTSTVPDESTRRLLPWLVAVAFFMQALVARTFGKADLVKVMSFVAIPSLIGPMIGPVAGGLIVVHLDWRGVFYVNVPVGLLGLYFIGRYLPDYREPKTHPLDYLGLVMFGGGIALLSWVLEVFGDHTLSLTEIVMLLAISGVLLTGYGIRAALTAFPLLDLALFRIRTFRAAVNGGFFTRLGLGGIPFLFPLLYQIGLGYSPVLSGLLVLPQAIASVGLKTFLPGILERLGYRTVLVGNTILVGLLIMSFATVGADTPLWRIVVQAFILGSFTSLQYTSMNTLVYADVSGLQTSAASTIAATGQQLSISFGVAGAALIAAIFVPPELHSHPAAIIHGVQYAFLVLGGLTILSSVVFMELRSDDAESLSHHDAARHHDQEH
jgi:MFS family permease